MHALRSGEQARGDGELRPGAEGGHDPPVANPGRQRRQALSCLIDSPRMKRAISLSNQSERPGDSQSKKQLDTQKMLEMRGKLHRAIQSKNTQLMQDILKNYTRNLDEIQDEDGNNLVILAAMQGDWRMLEILLTKAINPNKKNKHKKNKHKNTVVKMFTLSDALNMLGSQRAQGRALLASTWMFLEDVRVSRARM